jgi:hypothetical protein
MSPVLSMLPLITVPAPIIVVLPPWVSLPPDFVFELNIDIDFFRFGIGLIFFLLQNYFFLLLKQLNIGNIFNSNGLKTAILH